MKAVSVTSIPIPVGGLQVVTIGGLLVPSEERDGADSTRRVAAAWLLGEMEVQSVMVLALPFLGLLGHGSDE